MKPTIASIHESLGDLVFGENGQQLEDVVVELLKSKTMTIAIVDFGLGGAVAELIKKLDAKGQLLIHSEVASAEEIGDSLDDEEAIGRTLGKVADEIRTKSGADWGLAISEIDRDQERISQGKSHHHLAVRDSDSTTMGKFRFGGHSGWRETRAVKEILNFIRLHLSSV